ncbi:MAG: ATP-binding protein [Bacteroidota bacterium]
MEKKFKRELKSLEKISRFISEFITTSNIDDSHTISINLVVEELFTNMVKYNAENKNDISISLNKDGSRLIISLTDFDVEPFDVSKTGEVNVDQLLEDRKPGGLGIHIVKKFVDKIDYQYKNRQSKITLIRMLEE